MVGKEDWKSSSLPPTCWMMRLAALSAGPGPVKKDARESKKDGRESKLVWACINMKKCASQIFVYVRVKIRMCASQNEVWVSQITVHVRVKYEYQCESKMSMGASQTLLDLCMC